MALRDLERQKLAINNRTWELLDGLCQVTQRVSIIIMNPAKQISPKYFFNASTMMTNHIAQKRNPLIYHSVYWLHVLKFVNTGQHHKLDLRDILVCGCVCVCVCVCGRSSFCKKEGNISAEGFLMGKSSILLVSG